jgi:hypothetical protein
LKTSECSYTLVQLPSRRAEATLMRTSVYRKWEREKLKSAPNSDRQFLDLDETLGHYQFPYYHSITYRRAQQCGDNITFYTGVFPPQSSLPPLTTSPGAV